MSKPRKVNAPRLTGSKFKFGRKRGVGKDGLVSEVNINGSKRISLIKEDHIFRKERGSKLFRFIKKFSIFNRLPVTGGSKQKRAIRKHFLISEQRAWHELYKAGLPVPKFHKIDMRIKSKNYMGIFMEDFSKKHGKLYTAHERGIPLFFKKFSLKKNRVLLKTLAKDLVTINKLGYFPTAVDFWSFYKDKNTGAWKRVIFDFGTFGHKHFENKKTGKWERFVTLFDKNGNGSIATNAFGKKDKTYCDHDFLSTFSLIRGNLGKKEFDYFAKQYVKNAPVGLKNLVSEDLGMFHY